MCHNYLMKWISNFLRKPRRLISYIISLSFLISQIFKKIHQLLYLHTKNFIKYLCIVNTRTPRLSVYIYIHQKPLQLPRSQQIIVVKAVTRSKSTRLGRYTHKTRARAFPLSRVTNLVVGTRRTKNEEASPV